MEDGHDWWIWLDKGWEGIGRWPYDRRYRRHDVTPTSNSIHVVVITIIIDDKFYFIYLWVIYDAVSISSSIYIYQSESMFVVMSVCGYVRD
jgi:hypothetical protein